MNYQQKLRRNIKSTIVERLNKKDKNQNEYLILKLDDGEDVFVFRSHIKEERWTWLQEGKEYNFTVEEGNNSSNLLVDFENENNFS